MLAIFYIVYKYLETMIEETTGKRLDPHRFSLLLLIAAVLGVIFLPISYIKSPRGNCSYGPAAFMAYVAVTFYLVLTMHQLIRYRGCLPQKKRKVLYITLLCEITFSVYQCAVPSSLVSCIGIVLFNLSIYMTVESPDALRAEQLEFEVIIDENIPRKLKGDEIHLRQILINLLSNAVKYTPKGTVTLEITLLPSEMENKAKLFFSVKDTGIGIKEEDITKLYIPFERIEEKRNRSWHEYYSTAS